MCGVQERIYSIFFSGNLSSTQFVSVAAVLQFFYIDSSIASYRQFYVVVQCSN